MSTADLIRGSRRMPPKEARQGGMLALPLVVVLALVVSAVGFIAYVLWPRWPGPAVAPGAPSLPITIAGTPFNAPPAALRVPAQRHPGAHERVDLTFLWPSLDAPDPKSLASHPGTASAAAKTLERIFVTISAAGEALPPAKRVKTIYPRYTTETPVAGPEGLAVLAFREGTPYQGEDLIYDAEMPDQFLVRCTRNGAGPTPGTCLYSQRIDAADFVARIPRDWLNDWRFVDGNIKLLIKRLRPPERVQQN